jgi:hypothetical protein
MGRGVALEWRYSSFFVVFCFAGNCAGRFGKDSSTLARHLGGVMEDGNVASKGAIVAKRPNPEIGSTGIVTRVKRAVEQSVASGFMQVILEIAKGMEKGKIPEAKFMWDFLRRLQAEEEVQREDYESFAAVLWKEYQRLENKE